jgi:ABC-type antimicrobial peptide transport system permease subunit
MFLKNLLRRKTRTALTVLGISIGVAAIIGLGALANGLQAGYSSMLSGSKADLILSQPDSFDISYSSIDDAVEAQLAAMPEVSTISGMLQGIVQTEDQPYFFVFGYPEDSFILSRFQIVAGEGLASRTAQVTHGKPILLGSAAAEVLDKAPGDSLRLTGSVYRVVGLYQTGDAFEDSGAVLRLEDSQELLGKPRQVSVYYIQLSDPALRQRFMARVERQMPDLDLSGVQEFEDKQSMSDMLGSYVWVIGGLAILLGGVGMMNAQLMSVFERTREIGVLRALGWSSARVLWMILSEALTVCLVGGVFGVGLGYFLLDLISRSTILMGASTANIDPASLQQAFIVVIVMGLVAGLYPAWRASRLQPVEALRYEGGSGGKIRRLPVGGMAVQSLWQRLIRTLLTVTVIGITVGAIMALEGIMGKMKTDMTSMVTGANSQIMIRQADVSDTSLSSIDERIGDKIAALPEVESVSGVIFTAVMLPDSGGFFILQGYGPNEPAVRRFRILEGVPLSSNHQIILGRSMADALKKAAGDTLDLSGVRFRVVGIYESSISWEELGGVISLRDAQIFVGRPHKVTMYAVKVHDPAAAGDLVDKINASYPDAHAALSGEFAEEMPDFQASNGMLGGISVMAIFVGGVGVLNTMLMAVFERTREIGVLRALGWRRRAILGMILREALLLGLLGGAAGIAIAISLIELSKAAPMVGDMFGAQWTWEIFARAIGIALALGVLGGLYPAYRATRLQPIEALRYE